MTNWTISIQDYEIDGGYDLADAWRLDHILETAEQSGVHTQLNVSNVGSFASNWGHPHPSHEGNVYNIASNPEGGICTDSWSFLCLSDTDSELA